MDYWGIEWWDLRSRDAGGRGGFWGVGWWVSFLASQSHLENNSVCLKIGISLDKNVILNERHS